MSVNVWLTDQSSDISGYLRAKIGGRSDCCSLVRSVTNTELGPSSGVQITKTAAGTALAWLTEPLDGTDLTAAAWIFNVWAKESAAAANAALRFQVFRFTNAEAGTALLDDNGGTELLTTIGNAARTSGNATATTLNDGDRLVFKILIDDATAVSMAASQTVTVSYNGLYAKAEGDSYIVCPDAISLTANTPSGTITQVRRALKDTADINPFLSDNEIKQAIQLALTKYSSDRPRVAADYYSGDGSTYEFSLPRNWIWNYSTIKSIEYPTGDQTRTVLEDRDYEILERTLGTQPYRVLRFVQLTPESGTDNILVYYSTRHTHTDELDTIPAEDVTALVWLAASEAALSASAKMAASSDSTITADSVNYRDGQLRWKQVSEEFKKRYDEYISGGTVSAATGKIVDWDTNLSYGGDRIWHRRRWR